MKVRNFWNGNLSNIDGWMVFIFDRMSKGDQQLKSKSCRHYYRYYNDGDIPSGMVMKQGGRITRWTSEKLIEETLEENVYKTASKLIRKYMTPENRREFYISEAYDNLRIGLGNILDGSFDYWLSKSPISKKYYYEVMPDYMALKELFNSKKWDKLAMKKIGPTDRYVRRYVIENAITVARENGTYDDLKKDIDEMDAIIEKIFKTICGKWYADGYGKMFASNFKTIYLKGM